jgi:hypothetical protein
MHFCRQWDVPFPDEAVPGCRVKPFTCEGFIELSWKQKIQEQQRIQFGITSVPYTKPTSEFNLFPSGPEKNLLTGANNEQDEQADVQ